MLDLDGLLVDSEDAWGAAERRVVEGYGKPWDEGVRTLMLGRGPEDAATVLAEFLGAADPRAISRRLLTAAVVEFQRGIAARPGARELVEALRERGVPLGVATNSRRIIAELSLTSSGLGVLADTAVCAEDVARPKPAPDPYLAACAALGAPPGRCVGLEDSPVGVASAKAAGLYVIGCPSLPDTQLDAADAEVASLTELDIAKLLGRAGDGERGR